jgi:Arc/MetJ-type ribon-helix-helix transcriptional regulator
MGMIVLLAHCATPISQKQEMTTNRPQKKVFTMKAEVVREAVQRVLEKRNFILAAKQSNELHLETEWLEDQGYRSRVEVDLEPLSRSKTELTLTMNLEEKPLFRDKWEPMDEIGEDTYRILLGDIEMECYRVLYDRR